MVFLMTQLLPPFQYPQVAVHTCSCSTIASSHNTSINRYKTTSTKYTWFCPCHIKLRIRLIQHQQDWTTARIQTFQSSNSIYNDLISYRQFFVISEPAIREHAPVSYFHFITKRRSFSTHHRPSYTFSYQMHCCKPLNTTPCPPAKVSGFQSICFWIKGILLLYHYHKFHYIWWVTRYVNLNKITQVSCSISTPRHVTTL